MGHCQLLCSRSEHLGVILLCPLSCNTWYYVCVNFWVVCCCMGVRAGSSVGSVPNSGSSGARPRRTSGEAASKHRVSERCNKSHAQMLSFEVFRCTFDVDMSYIYIYTYTHTHTHTYVYVYTCVYIYIYVYTVWYIYIYIYMQYTYIYIYYRGERERERCPFTQDLTGKLILVKLKWGMEYKAARAVDQASEWCVYIYIYICTCILCIYIYIYMYVGLCIYIYIYIYV